MSKRIRTHLRTNVVGYVALFFAMAGGTAYALDGTNTVFSDDIVNGEVKSVDILDDGVGSIDIKNRSIKTEDLSNSSVQSGKILDGSITPVDTTGLVASGQVLWAVVNADGSVSRSSNGAVTASNQGTGNYEVFFNNGDLDPCASIAQISNSSFFDGAPGPGEAASNQGQDSGNDIDVRTFDSAGAAANRPFTVYVLCSFSGAPASTESRR